MGAVGDFLEWALTGFVSQFSYEPWKLKSNEIHQNHWVVAGDHGVWNPLVVRYTCQNMIGNKGACCFSYDHPSSCVHSYHVGVVHQWRMILIRFSWVLLQFKIWVALWDHRFEFCFPSITTGGGFTYVFYLFTPIFFRKMSKFDLHIFFRWVGEKQHPHTSIHDSASTLPWFFSWGPRSPSLVIGQVVEANAMKRQAEVQKAGPRDRVEVVVKQDPTSLRFEVVVPGSTSLWFEVVVKRDVKHRWILGGSKKFIRFWNVWTEGDCFMGT